MNAPSQSEIETKEIFRSCKRFLNHHHPIGPAKVLESLARECAPGERCDFYGEGPLIENFEQQIATLLGKETAVFMPSGTMAQVIALRIWSDEKKNKKFGMHSTSHLELHEKHAYSHLHSLKAELLGEADRVLVASDFHSRVPLAAIILELPHSKLGGALPEWEELVKMADWCRHGGVRFHLDGARLWESGPFYGREYSEICSLFDSVYVSFYKGLGGVAGAILAGPKNFVEEARVWQRRQGGNLISLFPYVISARAGLAHRLPKMPGYLAMAREIAAAVASHPLIEVNPERPHTNMMQLIFHCDPAKLETAFLGLALEKKVALFRKLERLPDGSGRTELTVGDATMDFSAAEIAGLLGEALERAR